MLTTGSKRSHQGKRILLSTNHQKSTKYLYTFVVDISLMKDKMFSYVTLPTVYEMARFLLIFYNSDLLFLQIYWLKFYSEKHHNHHQRNFFFNFLNLTGFGASQSLSTLNSIINLLFSKPESNQYRRTANFFVCQKKLPLDKWSNLIRSYCRKQKKRVGLV